MCWILKEKQAEASVHMAERLTIEVMRVGPLETNCYIISRTGFDGDAVVVDPGDSGYEIADYLKKHSLVPAAILLTHGHFDHILGVNDLKECFPGLKVFISKNEKALIENAELNASFYGEHITITPDVYLSKDSSPEFFGRSVMILETPGHTRGSICYYFRDDSLLFAGDTVFYGSYGRTDLPTGSMKEMSESLEYLLTELPGSTRVFPGHGPETTIAHERIIEGY